MVKAFDWLIHDGQNVPITEFNLTAEVDARDLFGEENINWQFCMKNATFKHKEACEFIIHIGSGPGSEIYAEAIMSQMEKHGCTPEFIRAYEMAWKLGATRVLFYAG